MWVDRQRRRMKRNDSTRKKKQKTKAERSQSNFVYTNLCDRKTARNIVKIVVGRWVKFYVCIWCRTKRYGSDCQARRIIFDFVSQQKRSWEFCVLCSCWMAGWLVSWWVSANIVDMLLSIEFSIFFLNFLCLSVSLYFAVASCLFLFALHLVFVFRPFFFLYCIDWCPATSVRSKLHNSIWYHFSLYMYTYIVYLRVLPCECIHWMVQNVSSTCSCKSNRLPAKWNFSTEDDTNKSKKWIYCI